MKLAKGLALLKLVRAELGSRGAVRKENAYGSRYYGGGGETVHEAVEQFDIEAFEAETKAMRRKVLELESTINATNWNTELPAGWWDGEYE